MPTVQSNGIEIYFDTYGDNTAEPILLIMGLGMQATGWDVAFCKALAQKNYYVIRYDNRDVGLSTHLDVGAEPDIFAALAGNTDSLAYTLDDLAEDAYGLLEALGIERANIVGASMGGMIAQLLTINHPEVVKSLVSIMSTTGEFGVGSPTPEVVQVLVTPPESESRDDIIASSMAVHRAIESPEFRLSDKQLMAFATQNYDRAYSPYGGVRQLCAILAADDRTERLGHIDVPVTVIHGDRDPLVDISGGEATAKAIPGADWVVIPGMGHGLPPQLWPQIIDLIDATAKRAEA